MTPTYVYNIDKRQKLYSQQKQEYRGRIHSTNKSTEVIFTAILIVYVEIIFIALINVQGPYLQLYLKDTGPIQNK
jgi:hypothetical protein